MKEQKPAPTMPRIPSGPFRTDGRSVAASTTPPKPAREVAAPAPAAPFGAPAPTLPPVRAANDAQGMIDAMREKGADPFAMLVTLAGAITSDRRRAVDESRSALAKVDADIATAEEMLADAKARRVTLAAELQKAESELAYAQKMVGGAR